MIQISNISHACTHFNAYRESFIPPKTIWYMSSNVLHAASFPSSAHFILCNNQVMMFNVNATHCDEAQLPTQNCQMCQNFYQTPLIELIPLICNANTQIMSTICNVQGFETPFALQHVLNKCIPRNEWLILLKLYITNLQNCTGLKSVYYIYTAYTGQYYISISQKF